MIRFIDLKGQIDDDPRFAFYDTITDMFVNLDGDQTWDCVNDFRKDFRLAKPEGLDLDRCLKLIPEDVPHIPKNWRWPS